MTRTAFQFLSLFALLLALVAATVPDHVEASIAAEPTRVSTGFDRDFGRRGVAFARRPSGSQGTNQDVVLQAPDRSVWMLTIRLPEHDSDPTWAIGSDLTHFDRRGRVRKHIRSEFFSRLLRNRQSVIDSFAFDRQGRLLLLVGIFRHSDFRIRGRLVRMHRSGKIDRSFGKSGSVELGQQATSEARNSQIVVLPDDRIVIRSERRSSRVFDSSGKPDTALEKRLRGSFTIAAVGAGGKIYTKRQDRSPTGGLLNTTRLNRLLSDGMPDPTWNPVIVEGVIDQVRELVNGSVVVTNAWLSWGGEPVHREVSKYLGTGQPDHTYGSLGVAQFSLADIDLSEHRARATMVAPDGSVAFGIERAIGYKRWYRTAWLDPNGTPDRRADGPIQRSPKHFEPEWAEFSASGDSLFVYGETDVRSGGTRSAISRYAVSRENANGIPGA